MCAPPSIIGSDIVLIKQQGATIANGQADRRLDHKLALFLEEVDIVRWTVDSQCRLLFGLLKTRDRLAIAAETQFDNLPDESRNNNNAQRKPLVNIRRQDPAAADHNHNNTDCYYQPPTASTMAAMAETALEPGRRGLLKPCGFSYMLLHDSLGELIFKTDDLNKMAAEALVLQETVCSPTFLSQSTNNTH